MGNRPRAHKARTVARRHVDAQLVPPAALRDDTLVEVLDQVRSRHARTRSQIMMRTGLSRAIVTQRVGELVARGLLEETERGPSTGGRAPRNITFRSDLGRVLAADLGATHISVALADIAGRLIAHREEPADIAAGPDAVLERVQTLFEDLLTEERPRPPLWGIGIGLPGPVEFDSGRPFAPPIMPGWDGFPVRETLETKYTVPVWVDNDVNLIALGEVRTGSGRDQELVVVVKIGTGIGMGIVEHGRLLRGAQGAAGDLGHIQVTEDPSILCRCGNIGCLEALAGGAAIASAAETAARQGRSKALAAMLEQKPELTATDVARAASHGDQVSLMLFNEAGRRLGIVLAGVVNLLNPSRIVIGGGVSEVGDTFLAAVRQSVYARSLPLATRDLAIQRAALGRTGGVIGAAMLVTDELFSRGRLPLWLPVGHPSGRPELSRQTAARLLGRPTPQAASA